MRSGLAVSFLAVTGCMPSVVESTLVETDDLGATYEVQTAGDGTTQATAGFRWVSGMADVLLDDGDSVSADDTPLDAGTSNDYQANVTAAAEHAFVLQRGATRIEHHVVTPSPFTLTSPPFAGTYDLEGTLTWAPTLSGATISIVARGTTPECATITLADDLVDTGSFSFTGADVKSADAMPPACVFTLDVQRTSVTGAPTSPLSSVALVSTHVESTTLALR